MGRIDRRIPRLRPGRDTRRGSGMHSVDKPPDDLVAYTSVNRRWREYEILDSNPNPGCRRRRYTAYGLMPPQEEVFFS
jgi:hypothetical protein